MFYCFHVLLHFTFVLSSYFHFKFYFLLFIELFLTLTVIISLPSVLSKLFFFPLDISQVFFYFFYFSFLNIAPFIPLLIFAHLLWILPWRLLFFNLVPIFLPFLTPFCSLPSLFYLHCKCYILLFFNLFLFHTLIVSSPSTFFKYFSFHQSPHSFLLL